MFTTYNPGNLIQRAACLMLATFIVTVSLSLGALAAQSAASESYSVIVTQLA